MSDNRQFADHVELGGANVYFKEEPTTDTTMANTSYFKTVDADGNPVKISRDNIMDIVKDCLGTILNGLTNQETVTKIPTLNGNTLGASTAATLASVLGVAKFEKMTSGFPDSSETNYWYVCKFTDKDGSNKIQIAMNVAGVFSSVPKLFYKQVLNGSWSAWKEFVFA